MEFKNVFDQIAIVAEHHRYQNPPALLLKIEDLASAAMSWLSDHLHVGIGGTSNISMTASPISLILCALGIGALGTFFLITWNARKQKLLKKDKEEFSGLAGQRLLDASIWRETANNLAQQGAWKESCRALYLSFLQRLDECGLCQYNPARSNFEYLERLSSNPAIQEAFRKVYNSVEFIWFGDYPAGKKDYELLRQALEDLDSAVGLQSKQMGRWQH